MTVTISDGLSSWLQRIRDFYEREHRWPTRSELVKDAKVTRQAVSKALGYFVKTGLVKLETAAGTTRVCLTDNKWLSDSKIDIQLPPVRRNEILCGECQDRLCTPILRKVKKKREHGFLPGQRKLIDKKRIRMYFILHILNGLRNRLGRRPSLMEIAANMRTKVRSKGQRIDPKNVRMGDMDILEAGRKRRGISLTIPTKASISNSIELLKREKLIDQNWIPRTKVVEGMCLACHKNEVEFRAIQKADNEFVFESLMEKYPARADEIQVLRFGLQNSNPSVSEIESFLADASLTKGQREFIRDEVKESGWTAFYNEVKHSMEKLLVKVAQRENEDK